MRVIRKFAKIMILPLMLLIGILHFVLNTATKLSSYLIGPLMLLIFGCGVYTVVKQLWSQTFLLALMEGACFLVLFGASFVKIMKFGFDFTSTELVWLAVGMVVAFLVSFLVIKLLMSYIRKHDFKVFGYYRIALGIIVLAYFGIKTLV